MSGSQVLTKQKVWFDGYEFRSDVSAMALEYATEPQDGTTLGDDTRIRLGGLKVADFALEGFWRGGTGNIDDILFSKVGLANSNVTMSSSGDPVAGAVVYMARGVVGNYSPLGGTVGEMARYTLAGQSDDQLVRGVLLHDSTGIATTGTGTWQTVGAAAAADTLFGVLHVVGAAGTTNTLDVIVEADSSTSAASPTTRLTFSQKSIVGTDRQSLAGASTDVVYRVSHTVAGATANFEYAVAVGILS
jgi:hypothetical protein